MPFIIDVALHEQYCFSGPKGPKNQSRKFKDPYGQTEKYKILYPWYPRPLKNRAGQLYKGVEGKMKQQQLKDVE